MSRKGKAALREVKRVVSGERFDAYARRTDGVMLVLAFAFLIIWSVTSIHLGLPDRLGRLMTLVNAIIWLVFLVDVIIRIVLAKSSWRWVYRHPLDILAVVFPALRPLKILTIFTSGTRLITSRGVLATGQAVVASVVLLLWVGAVSVFGAETRAPDHLEPQIDSFGEALWWALVTVTTVGYGDVTPVTTTGRIVAGAMMVVGIALLGVVTASVAAWFVKLTSAEQQQKEDASVAKNEREIRKLQKNVDELQSKIDFLVKRAKARDD